MSKSWNDLLTSESFKMMGKSVFDEDIERELMDASIVGNADVVIEIFSTFMVDVNKPCKYGAQLHVIAHNGHASVPKVVNSTRVTRMNRIKIFDWVDCFDPGQTRVRSLPMSLL